MQDTILRVLVVAVGLIMYPKEELRTVDQDDDVATVMQERQDWLLKEMEKTDQEMTVVSQKAPEEDQDESLVTVQPVNINEAKANQRVAPTDQYRSLEGLEDDQVKPTLLDEDTEEKETKVTEVNEDAADSDFYLSPVGQSDHSLAIIDPFIDEGLSLLDSDVHSIEKMFFQEVEINHNIPSVNPKVVPTNQEVLHEVQIDPLNLCTKPSREDQTKAVENHQEVFQQYRVPPQMLTEPSEKDKGRWKQVTDTENDYLWYLWNTYSLISVIHFSIKYYRKKLQMNQRSFAKKRFSSEKINMLREIKLSAEVSLPDSCTLNRLYDKCVKLSPNERYWVAEFVEGFASDLLCTMRSFSDRAVGMVMEDFVMVEGVFKFCTCDIMIPIVPLDPYHFQFEFGGSQAGDRQAPMEGYGRIKMEKGVEKQNGCPCGNTDIDMLCLLHSDEKVVDMSKKSSSPFLSPTTPYLSKTQVLKWFQRELRQAWEYISHKYEFELTFSNTDVPGTLSVRFRSGKVITFNIKPVVEFKGTAAYFVIGTSNKNVNNSSDAFWELSFAPYEDHFLKRLNINLPKNSCHIKCLEIAVFLHRKQTGLTGKSGLTVYHMKTALYHLLIKEPLMWHPEQLTNRLQDLLGFLENCLEHKKLSHAFFGNSLVSNTSLSQRLAEAKPVNLFHPLVVQKSLYFKTVKHFHELLKNMSVLIQEYAPKE
ncbi:inositol 1,4,5-trisphosphate receptor-interacting protein [Hypomesus transpacificus]|uniref:inositol 1,4,5-trisphosphate receptor-interacting protein n=1 Tax=Hypomesus transpacificus TaxID=137520 RepID=UPI001F076B4D|nr:inositol 1,4,5-trisphosphate receptor-interacting protein [Hypomesus transpacificus]